MKTLSILLFIIATLISCNKKVEVEAPKAVEDLTGYTTIKNGEKMKEKISDIEKIQQKLLKEAEEVE